MIVKDEQEALPRCLASVKGVVDEIVVLDTGSQDRTPELARDWGAQVYFFQWCNDFAAARNQALKYVQSQWVLVLDADEELVPEIVPLLKQMLQCETYLLVNLLRQEVGAKQAPYSLVSRLFRNHPDLSFTRPYHEWIDESVAMVLTREPHWQVGYLPQVAIRHTGYQQEAIARRQKIERARTTMAAFLATHPDDAYICSKLGALYVETGEMQQGLALLERGLQLDPTAASIRYELHYHLGLAYTELGQVQRAADHYQAATGQAIADLLKLGAYNNWGNLLKAAGNLTAAQALYQRTLELDPAFVIGYYNLGMTLKALGDLSGAIAAYQQAIQLDPTYAPAYQNLGVVLLKVGQVAASLSAFQRAIALQEQTHPAEANRLRQELTAMGLLRPET